MVKPLILCAVALLASGCGGGSGSGSVYSGGVIPSTPPTSAATLAPSSGAPLSTASLKGSPGFVNANQHTVYVFDADLGTPNSSNCTGACASFWPPVTPPPGNLPAPWASFVRPSDNITQLSYNGRAVYTLSTDANPGDVNGDGLNTFGGIWHIARPAAVAPPTSAPTMAPVPTQPPSFGGYSRFR